VPKEKYTFEQLMDWKARTDDPREQKKIRRMLRELRAVNPELPAVRRGVNKHSGIQQVAPATFDPADRSTWPTGRDGKLLGPENWTEDMHIAYIDWMAVHKPLHVVAHIDAAGVPQYGCACSKCTSLNGRIYDALVAENMDELARINEMLTALGRPAVDISSLLPTAKPKKAKKSKKFKVTKVSSI